VIDKKLGMEGKKRAK